MEILHQDPDTSLTSLALAPANAQYFLRWLTESFEERNERPMCMTTLRLTYKQMQTNYTVATGRKLPDIFNKQIHGVSRVSIIMGIQLTFTLQYLKGMMDSHNISLEKHARPMCSSVDLHSILMFNWCFFREGIAHDSNHTTMSDNGVHLTRQGVLIESSCYRGTNDSLRWKNVKLKSIKSAPSDVFVAELETTLIKGKRKMVEPIIFMLIVISANLVFCPILPLIALAFADAFANEGIRAPADLFRLRVEDPDKNYLEVPWKASILDTPIWRL